MHTLGIDIETYSPIDIESCGVHKYVAHPDFEIILLSYSLDEDHVVTIDLGRGEEVPAWFVAALTDADYKKTAFNAAFEMLCFNQYIEYETPISQWECTMVKAGMCGYPMSLDGASKAMGLEQQKDRSGKALIKFFSCPNKDGTRNLPINFPLQWSNYKKYNAQDVVVEQAVARKIKFFNIPEQEKIYWHLDQKINKTGIKLDIKLIVECIKMRETNREKLIEEAVQITGLANPNSDQQIKQWIEQITGEPTPSLTAEIVEQLLKEHTNPQVLRMLEIKQDIKKTSVKKFDAMVDCLGAGRRARGLFQFVGASKTWRWAGRLIQVQNLTHTKIKDLNGARNTVLSGDIDMLEIMYGNIVSVLSNLIRTCLIPTEGDEFVVSDFSAIEAVVTAWFAGEEWRMEVFRGDGKIYEASASQMFKVPIELVTKDSDYRKKGKISELALGYQGAYEAMRRMGAEKMGIADEEIMPLVKLWRSTNKKICKLWYDIDEAAIMAVKNPGKVYKLNNKLKFQVKHETLWIQLPSGHCLAYVKPWIKDNKFDKECVAYWGIDQKTKQWSKQETYGGKLLENIVQGTSRDILADAMRRLDEAGFLIVGHVHDEVILEASIAEAKEKAKKAGEIMSQDIPWAPDLPLRAATFTTPYYIKD